MNKSNSHVDFLRVISSEFILSYLFNELFYEWAQYRRFCCMSYKNFKNIYWKHINCFVLSTKQLVLTIKSKFCHYYLIPCYLLVLL